MRRWLRLLAVAVPLLLAACVPQAVRVKGDAGLLDAQLARERALAQADRAISALGEKVGSRPLCRRSGEALAHLSR